MRRLAALAASAALSLGLAACAPRADGPIVLTYATSYSPTHPFSRADADWIRYVETASHGRLKIKPYWSGSLLSADQSMLEIRHGVADIGLITPIYVLGGAHLTSAQTAFYAGARSIDDQVAVYKCLAQAFPPLQRELDGLRVLMVQGGNLPGVITRDRPVRSPADIRGLRLRVPEENVGLVRALGGDPVSMPMSEVYPAMAKGVIDGVLVAPDALGALHLAEVAHYYSDLHTPRGAYPARAMSEARFRSLPPDLQKVLLDSEAVWEGSLSKDLGAAAKKGLAYGKGHGMTMIAVSPEAQQAFDAAYIDVTRRDASRLDRYGASGAAMLAYAQTLIANTPAGQPVACPKEQP